MRRGAGTCEEVENHGVWLVTDEEPQRVLDCVQRLREGELPARNEPVDEPAATVPGIVAGDSPDIRGNEPRFVLGRVNDHRTVGTAPDHRERAVSHLLHLTGLQVVRRGVLAAPAAKLHEALAV